MLRCLIGDAQQGVKEILGMESFHQFQERPQTTAWVELFNPSEKEFEVLENNFQFHTLAVDDCRGAMHRPRVDDYRDYAFLITHAPAEKPKKKSNLTTELFIFIGPNYLVTIHWTPLDFLEEVYQKHRTNHALLEKGPDFVLYTLLNALINAYFPLLDRIEERLEALEEQVFNNPNRQTLNQIFHMRRDLIALRRNMAPQRDTFNTLLHLNENLVKDTNSFFLIDLHNHMLRVMDTVDTFREMATGILEAYLSVSSNRLNEVMKTLTVITTIMMPLGVVAGIYGMNFRIMPELNWRYGYFMALAVMGIITGTMLLYFRRKKWF
ncbi:MAG: magnesium/cobalt transporter CorA [Bacillota bacterium]